MGQRTRGYSINEGLRDRTQVRSWMCWPLCNVQVASSGLSLCSYLAVTRGSTDRPQARIGLLFGFGESTCCYPRKGWCGCVESPAGPPTHQPARSSLHVGACICVRLCWVLVYDVFLFRTWYVWHCIAKPPWLLLTLLKYCSL